MTDSGVERGIYFKRVVPARQAKHVIDFFAGHETSEWLSDDAMYVVDSISKIVKEDPNTLVTDAITGYGVLQISTAVPLDRVETHFGILQEGVGE